MPEEQAYYAAAFAPLGVDRFHVLALPLKNRNRPYKRGKTLSESLQIMAGMSRGGHLDPEVFALFLRSGVHLAYARRYMRPEQIDVVDVEAVLARPEVPAAA